MSFVNDVILLERVIERQRKIASVCDVGCVSACRSRQQILIRNRGCLLHVDALSPLNACKHPVLWERMMNCQDSVLLWWLLCMVCMCEVAAGCGSSVKVDRWLLDLLLQVCREPPRESTRFQTDGRWVTVWQSLQDPSLVCVALYLWWACGCEHACTRGTCQVG